MANSRIGAEQLTVAKLLTDVAGGSATYDTPVALAKKLMKVGIAHAASREPQYADDQTVDVYEDDGDITITIDVTDLTEDEKALLFGQTMVAGVRTPSPDDVRPYFCVMWKSKKRNGHYKYYKVLKAKFSEPNEDFETKKMPVAAQTDSIVGTGIQRVSDGLRKRVADADSTTWVAATGTNWFTSGDISPDTTPPTIESTTPAADATGIAVSSNVVWVFSEAILPATVVPSNFFVVKDTDGTPVAGALSQSADGLTITFDPTSNLSASTAYRAVATTGIKDLSANALAAIDVRKFTTA